MLDRIAGRPGGGWDNDETKIDLIKKGYAYGCLIDFILSFYSTILAIV